MSNIKLSFCVLNFKRSEIYLDILYAYKVSFPGS